MNDEPMRPWAFEPKGNTSFQMPNFVDDEPEFQSPRPSLLAGFISGLVSIALLSFCEGTLAWVALEHVEDIGWIDNRVGWVPVLAITVCINLIRGFDRAVFRRN
jgi:hypothetical protein